MSFGLRGSAHALGGLVLGLLIAAVAAARPPTAAPGGGGLLEAMESGSLTIVGRIGQIERLDLHGYRASIWVERILGPRAREHEAGTPIEIAWEELATSRPPRFSNSDRALVCLERLGTASIWRQRIPDPMQRRQIVAIANGGDAFLRNPSLSTLEQLHHYLSLAPTEREAASGTDALVQLAEAASLPLAIDAAQRLARIPDLGEKLGKKGEQSLMSALLREDADPALVVALLPVFAAAATGSLADALRRQREDPHAPPTAARIFEASAQMPDGLDENDLTWLFARDEARYRVIAIDHARTAHAATLRKLLATDPAAEVRASALTRLITLEDDEALQLTLASLADDDPRVRSTAARGAAAFGARGVSGLREVAYGSFEACAGSADAPRSAIVGLSLSGVDGRKTLNEIARSHPDESLRSLAKIALGSISSDSH